MHITTCEFVFPKDKKVKFSQQESTSDLPASLNGENLFSPNLSVDPSNLPTDLKGTIKDKKVDKGFIIESRRASSRVIKAPERFAEMSFNRPRITCKPASSKNDENIRPTGGRVEKKKLQSVVVVPATTKFKPMPTAFETELRDKKREAFKHESGYKNLLPTMKEKVDWFKSRYQYRVDQLMKKVSNDEVVGDGEVGNLNNLHEGFMKSIQDYNLASEAYWHFRRESYDIRQEIKAYTGSIEARPNCDRDKAKIGHQDSQSRGGDEDKFKH
uniref:Uncharacterized protein n=1 Tax=Panagrolaimus davidi TaxID=227884 RepID=A0A914QDB7_9BILA